MSKTLEIKKISKKFRLYAKTPEQRESARRVGIEKQIRTKMLQSSWADRLAFLRRERASIMETPLSSFPGKCTILDVYKRIKKSDDDFDALARSRKNC